MSKAKEFIEFLGFGKDFKRGDRVEHPTQGAGVINIPNHHSKGNTLVDWDNGGRSHMDASRLKKSTKPLPKGYDPKTPQYQRRDLT